MPEQYERQAGPPGGLPQPGGQRRHQVDGPFPGALLGRAAVLVERRGEAGLIELGRGDDGADLVGERARMVAVAAGVAADAVKHQQQQPRRAGWAVAIDRQRRAGDRRLLLRETWRDDCGWQCWLQGGRLRQSGRVERQPRAQQPCRAPPAQLLSSSSSGLMSAPVAASITSSATPAWRGSLTPHQPRHR
jgi:hypothetical protein